MDQHEFAFFFLFPCCQLSSCDTSCVREVGGQVTWWSRIVDDMKKYEASDVIRSKSLDKGVTTHLGDISMC